ncbi:MULTISPECIES: nuclease-related domain-containing protein [Pontibacillus]|uniref:Nuclease-related domain-containing protein n=1 Tax=Pontibacillus chungwhensis TaxID=265426 RepID=A0ABY8UT90_9BACI|nr:MULTISPECIES: nuclease-related domain-containing protein [Pontibacillus]MCD5323516.1 NERD domain-containing protein [Pontibacillus sp. HN14]WIF96887.1 nuclease-related domain-containing protein [Pontibacillus chungwhensis]
MIVKKRTIPFILRQEEVLEKRLPYRHPKKSAVMKSISKRRAGYWGEQELDYPLSYLDDRQYHIFHDLRIVDGDKVFQIDTLLVTNRVAIILEVKNISGIIQFDPTFSQLIRKGETREERLPNPLVQVGRQRRHLSKWFSSHHIALPIKYCVVFTHPSAVIKSSELNPHQHAITQVENLFDHIVNLESQFNTPTTLPGNMNQMILDAHTPLSPTNILDKYSISYDELQKGVECPKCKSFHMNWLRKRWRCSTCHYYSRDSHKQAIVDYFLLGFPYMNNAIFRDFVRRDDSRAASYFLSKMDFQTSGHKRSLRYHSPHL